jgi:hypothetical protein
MSCSWDKAWRTDGKLPNRHVVLSLFCLPKVLELPRLIARVATLNQHVVLSLVQSLKFQKLPLSVASVARQHVPLPFCPFR